MKSKEQPIIEIHFDGPVSVGTFVKVENGATYIKNNFPGVREYREERAEERAEEIAEEDAGDDGRQDDGTILDRLSPIFFGNRHEAEGYLRAIRFADDAEIGDITRGMIVRKKISELSKNKHLYNILHQAGLYRASYSNWYKKLQ